MQTLSEIQLACDTLTSSPRGRTALADLETLLRSQAECTIAEREALCLLFDESRGDLANTLRALIATSLAEAYDLVTRQGGTARKPHARLCA